MRKLLFTLLFLGLCFSAYPANRHWVGNGGNTNWNSSPDTNWGSASGLDDNASIPGAADDVIFDHFSPLLTTANISADITVLSVNTTGAAMTWTHANDVTLTIGGSLTIDVNMTYAPSDDSQAIKIIGTGIYRDGGAHTLGDFTVDGSGITVTPTSDLTLRSDATLTLTEGTLDTNDVTVGAMQFVSSNTNTRTLDLGASAVNLTGGGYAWDCYTVTNFTLTAGTSTITLSGTNAYFRNGVGLTYATVVFSGSGNARIYGVTTFASLGRMGTAVKTDSLTLINDITITTGLIIVGNSVINRVLLHSNSLSTVHTITFNGFTVIADNADFQNITGAGAGSWNISGSSTGDCGGNSGITFKTAATHYWVSNGGNWSDASHWSLATGGLPIGDIPLPQDTAIFDSNSFSIGAQTVEQDMPRLCADIDWTGVTDTPTWAIDNLTQCVYGSLTLVAGMNVDVYSGDAYYLLFFGRGVSTLTTGGHTLPKTFVYVLGGSLVLQDAATFIREFRLVYGTLDANGFDVTVPYFHAAVASIRSLLMGSGTWTLTGNYIVWATDNPSNFTFDAETSTIVISDTGAGNKQFKGGNLTFNNLSITGGGTGTVYLQDSSTFNTFTINNPKVVYFENGKTTTVSEFVATGDFTGGIEINTYLDAGVHYLSDSGGTNEVAYCTITNSIAQGGAVWDATDNCVDGGNNAGWVFSGAERRVMMFQ